MTHECWNELEHFIPILNLMYQAKSSYNNRLVCRHYLIMPQRHAQFATEFVAGRNFKTRLLLLLWLTQMTLLAISVKSATPLLVSHASPCNKYLRRLRHLISSRSRSSDTTLSCSQSHHHTLHTCPQRLGHRFWVLNCCPNRTTNPRKLQYCTASNFPFPGNWNVWPIHW